MKTTGGFKLWQIIYPIGIYYVVSSLMYFVLGLFLGDGQQTYMLRQLICSAATIPATMSFISRIKLQSRLSMELKKKNWIQNGSQTQFWQLWVQRHLALP